MATQPMVQWNPPIQDDLVHKKIHRMGTFHAGWHFGAGSPIRPDALHAVLKLYEIGKALNLVADVFPHEDGDASIMFKTGNRYLEVLCLPEKQFSFTVEEGTKHPFDLVEEKEEVSLPNVIKALLSFAGSESLWRFFDSYTPTSIAFNLGDSPLSVFKTPRATLTEHLGQETSRELASPMTTAFGNTLLSSLSASILGKSMEIRIPSEAQLFTGVSLLSHQIRKLSQEEIAPIRAIRTSWVFREAKARHSSVSFERKMYTSARRTWLG